MRGQEAPSKFLKEPFLLKETKGADYDKEIRL